ncbi:glyoxalase-like domain protein [Mycobacterium ulcerans str. Harvey]|uniref:Glyoxalase-like domain protein n=1 Tax=Mycobacterium ulcerans str. Harvey TaxID=1299332 RepID=A0ABP3AR30_MYCUL|nr:glyoxalase-like domain protein [Mycobacterium ulcerans str. Harvey]
MTLSVEMVTFDCSDPARLAGWWAEHFGGTAHELLPGEFIAVTRPAGRGSDFRRCPIQHPEKNRVHLDFSAADVDGEVSRLAAAGATEVQRHQFGENFRWVVMADPEGNVFCVVGQ